ncbi:hypothetical protein Poli38472_003325 [Pythium oligandrum]|uniref:Threonine synthase n=1 Tax=Pythium oligandrum TaxID=41045 RepID=A0A8K1C6L6_PYTOL|nr:hypothetical protein Poli38472_003325 [Pythium oligandrum]|eukprot:TMW57400.1 hypothetical protein Poli38472_003325 [Pythium oligandrum]
MSEKELEYEQLTDLVSGEIDRQLKERNDVLDSMKTQMSKVLNEFEDLTWHVQAKRSWMKSIGKISRDIQPTNPAAVAIHPVTTNGAVGGNATSPSKLPKLSGLKARKKIHQQLHRNVSGMLPPAEGVVSDARGVEGKIIFDKKLPRVANMEKRTDVLQSMLATQQKQMIWHVFVAPLRSNSVDLSSLLDSDAPSHSSLSISLFSMVKYRSTRGGVRGLTFEEAVLTGLASDRGLLLPEADQFPKLPPNALEEWSKLSYQALAVKVMRLFIDESEISTADLKALVQKSYNSKTFRHKETAPVVKVTEQLYVLELFHGPTFAFKDIALQFLGNLFEFFLKRKNAAKAPDAPKHSITVVGATSGDTGSSAIYGLRGKENVDVFILFPHGRVSQIQERQMTTVWDENIHNVQVRGTFDDCQAIVKDLFADASFKAKYNLGAVNSINWARILAQIVYYVYAYFRVREQGVKDVTFSVPTGNFGDILAGFYAKKLGVPIEKLIVATNENDILHRFFSTGKYHRHQIQHTSSPSMDICVSSNFERYLFALCGEDPDLLRQWMQGFEKTGELTIQGDLLKKAQAEMGSFAVLEPEVNATISQYHQVHKYLFDPHSAIGAAAAERFGFEHLADRSDAAVVVVGTAHYGKFLPVVSKALDVAESEIEQHPNLKALEALPTRSVVRDNAKTAVAQLIKETKDKRRGGKSLVGSNTLVTASIVAAAAVVVFFVASRARANN